MVSGTIDAAFENKDQLARIRQEAQFGRREIEEYIRELPAGANVLEIGSGTGYLIATLASAYPKLNFFGIEPIGQGFQEFDRVLTRMEDAVGNLTIYRAAIESFEPPEAWPGADLIFSVNVFEHLDDWRVGLDQSMALLTARGKAVILCPNYSFPYEPHFAIPVLVTPAITRRVFSSKIEAIEASLAAEGLWKSLNFIKIPQVAKHAARQGYAVRFDNTILSRMLKRLRGDPEFASRQRLLAPVAILADRLGAGWISTKLPARVSPYLKAVLTRLR